MNDKSCKLDPYVHKILHNFELPEGVNLLNRVKILLAENSVVSRMALLEIINSTDYGMVERTASNGSLALEWLAQSEINVVLIDVMIIQNEGFEIIKSIKSKYPHIEIILMSNELPESASITLDALKAGAMDFIQKPTEKEWTNSKDVLKSQLQALFTQILLNKYADPFEDNLSKRYISNEIIADKQKVNPQTNSIKNDVSETGFHRSADHSNSTMDNGSHGHVHIGSIDLILIASSTGGPVALEKLFSSFPTEIRKPILIVQHMPPDFTKLLAQKLEEKYHLNFNEAMDNEIVKADKILIAPGGKHMVIETRDDREKIVKLINTGYVNGVKPSADVLFQSVANTYKGKNILVVVLTGMGNDGTQGIRTLKNSCNCYCLTQSESTCVVYGMPKCVVQEGLSDEVIDLEKISSRIRQIIQ